MIAVIDCGVGDPRGVREALRFVGAPCEITASARRIATASGVVLPGPGTFRGCMANLHVRGLAGPVRAAALEALLGRRPFLGIGPGMHVLFGASEECPGGPDMPGEPGLGLLPGRVEELRPVPGEPHLKFPHMGWNSVSLRKRCGIFSGIPEGAFFYFVHSFFVRAEEPGDVAARTAYGAAFDAAVTRALLSGTQFQPEKSGETGLLLLKNFMELSK
ncbi:MAG: imidazole glycerol phosphate synthase subunit HisH [Oscillospiraceae bacterium]|nr:imidazole glycerol phosphate synthase subunit HisH [Oscillospiraceae bacterium]